MMLFAWTDISLETLLFCRSTQTRVLALQPFVSFHDGNWDAEIT